MAMDVSAVVVGVAAGNTLGPYLQWKKDNKQKVRCIPHRTRFTLAQLKKKRQAPETPRQIFGVARKRADRKVTHQALALRTPHNTPALIQPPRHEGSLSTISPTVSYPGEGGTELLGRRRAQLFRAYLTRHAMLRYALSYRMPSWDTAKG